MHAGTPRTGTTSLQHVLSRLRPELLAAGVLYPELTPRSADAAHLSHQHLGEALDGRRPRAERTELLASLSAQVASTDADVVLLSYESLCLLPPRLGVPSMLAALFARHGFAMEVLATVKPQAAQLNSSYTWRMQFLRERRVFRDYARAAVGSGALDLARLFEPWRAACDGRVRAVPVRDHRSSRPLVERVLAELDLPAAAALLGESDGTLVENRSPGAVAVEAMRRLRLGGAHLAAGRAAREVTRFVEQSAAERGLNASPFKGPDAGTREQARARWAGSNERFARAVWGEAWAARVADEPDAAPNEVASMADAGDAGRAAGEIAREACARFGITLHDGPAWGARLGHALRHARLAIPRGGG